MLKDKRKFLISIGAVIFVNLALLALNGLFYSHVLAKKENYFEIVEKTALYEQRSNNFRDLEKDFRRTEQERKTVESIFLNKISIIDFLELVESLALKAGVDAGVKTVDFFGKDKSINPKFTIKVSGNFNDIYYFISLIESAVYHTALAQIRINSSFFEPDDRVWEGFFGLVVLNYNDN